MNKEHKIKIGLGNKGKIHSKKQNRVHSEFMKGKKKTKEQKNKLSKKMKIIMNNKNVKDKIIKNRLGTYHSEKTKEKMRLAKLGKKLSKEHKKNISKNHKGMLNKKHSNETKKKLRIAAFNYVKKRCNILYPNIGHNEKQILDKLEKELNIKILRQYKCEGYFIDGYIKEINVAIEIDEIPKIKEKDIDREKIIKNKLNCKFMRINDFD